MSEHKMWQEYSQAFAFLARIINYPPDIEMIEELQELSFESDVSQNDLDTHPAYQSITGYFEDKKEISMDELLRQLSVDWTRLFRGVSKGYGPPPPYEGIYREKDGLGLKIIQEVEQAYLKYGLVISGEQRDRPDYLGYELNFAKFLCEQIAQAIENDMPEEERYRLDFYDFVTEHLSAWVGDFCAIGEEHAKTPFYSAVLMLLNDTVSDVAAGVISQSK